ncbi:unnamed protein product [Durusdinium trenchii]|uniref:Uncharacterized protein n=1 Tax=Durusdinium trenchii TaxID=1381693 RepID=A0ABP0PGF9_9DINO
MEVRGSKKRPSAATSSKKNKKHEKEKKSKHKGRKHDDDYSADGLDLKAQVALSMMRAELAEQAAHDPAEIDSSQELFDDSLQPDQCVKRLVDDFEECFIDPTESQTKESMLHDRWGRPFIPFPDLSLHDIYADHGNAAAEEPPEETTGLESAAQQEVADSALPALVDLEAGSLT